MAQHEERGLVLAVSDYRETSSLVRLLTENEGRITLVARGLRKTKVTPAIAALQPFNLVRVRYFLKEGSTMGTLADVELERAAAAARSNLESYAIISYWFEILRETSQERAALTDVFELSLEMLRSQPEQPPVGIDFLKRLSLLCQFLGFGISWKTCVQCGKDTLDAAGLSISRGGIICRDCFEVGQEGIPLKSDEKFIISAMRDNGKTEMPASIAQSTVMDFLTLVHRFMIYHLEHPLKTFRFLQDTLSE